MHIHPGHPAGKPDQMSPTRAAVPRARTRSSRALDRPSKAQKEKPVASRRIRQGRIPMIRRRASPNRRPIRPRRLPRCPSQACGAPLWPAERARSPGAQTPTGARGRCGLARMSRYRAKEHPDTRQSQPSSTAEAREHAGFDHAPFGDHTPRAGGDQIPRMPRQAGGRSRPTQS